MSGLIELSSSKEKAENLHEINIGTVHKFCQKKGCVILKKKDNVDFLGLPFSLGLSV